MAKKLKTTQTLPIRLSLSAVDIGPSTAHGDQDRPMMSLQYKEVQYLQGTYTYPPYASKNL
jgi:hypothetical protein